MSKFSPQFKLTVLVLVLVATIFTAFLLSVCQMSFLHSAVGWELHRRRTLPPLS